MPCCGDARAASRRETTYTSGGAPAAWAPGSLSFEYTGHGQMTVTGPLTGTIYRFPTHGARMQVHASDVPSLAAVPGLRPVR
jgi:hypothetical protein